MPGDNRFNTDDPRSRGQQPAGPVLSYQLQEERSS